MFNFLEAAKEFLLATSSHLDEHTTKKGFVEVVGDTATLYTPDHIQFAKYGREKGEAPPIQGIIKWVNAKGIQFDGMTKEGTAWAIRGSIAKNGTKGHTKNAPNVMEEAIREELSRYNENLADLIAVEVDTEIRKFNEKTFKKTETFKI